MRIQKCLLCLMLAVIMCLSVAALPTYAKEKPVTILDLPQVDCNSRLYTVTAQVLNVRAKASTKARIKLQLKKGDPVLINEKSFKDKNGTKWVHIFYGCGNSQSGYVAARYLKHKDEKYVYIGFSNYDLTVYDNTTGKKTGEKIAAGRFTQFLNCAGAKKSGRKIYYYDKVRYNNRKENFVKIAMKNVDVTYYCKIINFTN